jgi:hypothetical protein
MCNLHFITWYHHPLKGKSQGCTVADLKNPMQGLKVFPGKLQCCIGAYKKPNTGYERFPGKEIARLHGSI